VTLIPGAWREGDAVFLVGAPELSLDGSEYQSLFLGGPAGRPPQPELGAETALIRFLWCSAPVLTLAHDAAEGGVAVALAEAAIFSGVGARIELEEDAVTWFAEGGGIVVVACKPDDESALEGLPYRQLGTVGGPKILGVEVEELADAYGADL
jgi:phosphoribosylformylglycinamidine synthase